LIGVIGAGTTCQPPGASTKGKGTGQMPTLHEERDPHQAPDFRLPDDEMCAAYFISSGPSRAMTTCTGNTSTPNQPATAKSASPGRYKMSSTI